VAIEGIPIYGVLRTLVRRLPRFYLRRRYPVERLAKLIYLDFQPRCESALINLGEAASVRLILQLINLSPFPVEIDRASFRFHYAGGTANLSSLNRTKVDPGAATSLYLETELADGHANHMRRNWQGNQAWLDGNVEFNCSVHPFAKKITSLTDIQLTVLNATARTPDA
jgi:hypothetical protein